MKGDHFVGHYYVLFDKAYKKEVVKTLSQLMNDHYIFPDVAKETEKHLNTQLKMA